MKRGYHVVNPLDSMHSKKLLFVLLQQEMYRITLPVQKVQNQQIRKLKKGKNEATKVVRPSIISMNQIEVEIQSHNGQVLGAVSMSISGNALDAIAKLEQPRIVLF